MAFPSRRICTVNQQHLSRLQRYFDEDWSGLGSVPAEIESEEAVVVPGMRHALHVEQSIARRDSSHGRTRFSAINDGRSDPKLA